MSESDLQNTAELFLLSTTKIGQCYLSESDSGKEIDVVQDLTDWIFGAGTTAGNSTELNALIKGFMSGDTSMVIPPRLEKCLLKYGTPALLPERYRYSGLYDITTPDCPVSINGLYAISKNTWEVIGDTVTTNAEIKIDRIKNYFRLFVFGLFAIPIVFTFMILFIDEFKPQKILLIFAVISLFIYMAYNSVDIELKSVKELITESLNDFSTTNFNNCITSRDQMKNCTQ